MDVSNSTGSGTDYRVVASGGAAPMRPGRGSKKEIVTVNGEPCEVLRRGKLEPHQYATLRLTASCACTLQFLQGGKVVAEQTIEPKDGADQNLLIALVPNGKGVPQPHLCRRQA
jgi:hypothetical protein